MTKIMLHGDQRSLYVQVVTNKRRAKRKGRKKFKCKLSLEERVFHVLDTGKLKDYTHPKEIDPFWDILYRQFEYMVYLDIYYRRSIKYQTEPMTDEEIYDIYVMLCLIKSYKKMLVHYMHNFMYLMYGSVMNRRFYGWTKYMDRFISSFKELSIKNINLLRFDVNKTRCSVYYFQAFWLHGLNIINDISNYISKRHYVSDNSKDDIWIFDNIDEDNMFYDDNFTMFLVTDEKEIETTEESKDKVNDCAADFDFDITKDDKQLTKDNPETKLSNVEIENNDIQARAMIRQLLLQIGLPSDYIYKAEDRQIKRIGKLIKKKLKDNELYLTETQLTLLRTVATART